MATSCIDKIVARRAYTECGALDKLIVNPPMSAALTKFTLAFDWTKVAEGESVHFEIKQPTVGDGCSTCSNECCVKFCIKTPKPADAALLKLVYQNMSMSTCFGGCAHIVGTGLEFNADANFMISCNIAGLMTVTKVAPAAVTAIAPVTSGRAVVWDAALKHHRGVKDAADVPNIIGIAYGDCEQCEVVRLSGHLEVGLEMPIDGTKLFVRTAVDATHPILGGFVLSAAAPAGFTAAPVGFAKIDRANMGDSTAILVMG
jgi:hypothetical protein